MKTSREHLLLFILANTRTGRRQEPAVPHRTARCDIPSETDGCASRAHNLGETWSFLAQVDEPIHQTSQEASGNASSKGWQPGGGGLHDGAPQGRSCPLRRLASRVMIMIWYSRARTSANRKSEPYGGPCRILERSKTRCRPYSTFALGDRLSRSLRWPLA